MKATHIALLVLVCALTASAVSIGGFKDQQQIDNGVDESPGVRCTLCGIVINEVEGMATENRTEQELIKLIEEGLCDHLGGVKGLCYEIASQIPEILTEITDRNSVSVICVKRGYCEEPFNQRNDPISVPTYDIDLDLPPNLRWRRICSNSTYQQMMGEVLAGLKDLFHNASILSDLGKTINYLYFPAEFGAEIRGCAEEMKVDMGWLTLFNMGYEVTDGCTSIVAQTNDNKIYHVRNMDFWDGIWLTNHLKNLTIQVNYQSKGKTVFRATTFAGYVGVLSGMRPNGFSVTINTRNYPKNGIVQLFYEVIAALTERNASLVSFLTRHTLTRLTNFEDAVSTLTKGILIADVYFTVGGVSENQGAVITRNRENASDVWRLQAPTRWYLAQTNYDHWVRPPWFDDRIDPANHAMEDLSRNNLTLSNLLTKVLSVKPVLNLQSTFSMLACAADDTFISYARDCHYPCAE